MTPANKPEGRLVAARHARPASAPRKIMVVDDDVEIRDLLLVVLEDEGYTVVGASNGQRALDLLPREQPDLIILDIMMPGLDGREVLRQIQERHGADSPPVILMSAAIQGSLLRDVQTAAAFITKPFDLDHFLDTIDQILTDPE